MIIQLFGLDRAAAMNSGSEAIDLSIKIARKWGYRVKKIPANEALILTVTANYHGRSMVPLSASDSTGLKDGMSALARQTFVQFLGNVARR